jgi:hypothetical protein
MGEKVPRGIRYAETFEIRRENCDALLPFRRQSFDLPEIRQRREHSDFGRPQMLDDPVYVLQRYAVPRHRADPREPAPEPIDREA